MDDITIKEIKNILTGRITMSDGLIESLDKGFNFGFQGLQNGWGNVKFRGLSSRTRRYDITNNPEEGYKEAKEQLKRIGKQARLKSMPELFCVIGRPFMNNPVFLCLSKEEYMLELTLYTGKDLAAGLEFNRVFKSFEKGLSENVAVISNNLEE